MAELLAYQLLRWLGIGACALVLAGCICRLDMMRLGRHKLGWLAMYLLFAPFAFGMLMDLLAQRGVNWYDCFGLAGVLVHMHLTRHHWRRGPPNETLTGGTA